MAQFFGAPVVAVSAENTDGTLTPLEKEINDVFAGVNSTDRQKIQRWYGTKLFCVKCHLEYRMLTSMGKWECAQHACHAVVNAEHTDVYWPCCGRTYMEAPGCVPADHTTHALPYAYVHDIDVGKHLANRLEKLGPGLHLRDTKNDAGKVRTYVVRHDLARANLLALQALDPPPQ